MRARETRTTECFARGQASSASRRMGPSMARPKRFFSEFAALEPERKRSHRTAWVVGAVVLAAGLGLALFDLFAR